MIRQKGGENVSGEQRQAFMDILSSLDALDLTLQTIEAEFDIERTGRQVTASLTTVRDSLGHIRQRMRNALATEEQRE